MVEILLEEYMEMPCLCDCGRWFDLNDGFRSLLKPNGIVVCKACHTREEEIEDIRDQIIELDRYGNKKREIKKLTKRLNELGVTE